MVYIFFTDKKNVIDQFCPTTKIVYITIYYIFTKISEKPQKHSTSG